MKKKFLLVLPFAFLMACGAGNKGETEKVDLSNVKDKLSYAMGVENARGLLKEDSKFETLDKDMLKKGFGSNLSDEDPTDCKLMLQNLFGPYGQDFDTTYLKEGSECIGRIRAFVFYAQIAQAEQLEKFNLDMLKKGFEHGLYDLDTVNLNAVDRASVLDNFYKDVQAEMQQKQQQQDQANIAAGIEFWNKVKAIPGVKEIDGSGVYLEVIEQGTGGSPAATDDVEAHYLLTNAIGDTMDNSFVRGTPLSMNLGGLIQGWAIGCPKMKKGGKYNLYVPGDKAYNAGPLCFYIELLDYAPAGVLASPPQMPAGY